MNLGFFVGLVYCLVIEAYLAAAVLGVLLLLLL